jgi:hypothetical protein
VGPAPPHGRVRHRVVPLLGSPPLSRVVNVHCRYSTDAGARGRSH